jgi:hypothetical protein
MVLRAPFLSTSTHSRSAQRQQQHHTHQPQADQVPHTFRPLKAAGGAPHCLATSATPMGRPHAAMRRQQPSSSVPEAAHTPHQPCNSTHPAVSSVTAPTPLTTSTTIRWAVASTLQAAPRALRTTRRRVLAVLTAPVVTEKQPPAQSNRGVADPKYPCWAVHSVPPLCATPAHHSELNIAPRPPNATTLDVPARPAPSAYLPPHSATPTLAHPVQGRHMASKRKSELVHMHTGGSSGRKRRAGAPPSQASQRALGGGKSRRSADASPRPLPGRSTLPPPQQATPHRRHTGHPEGRQWRIRRRTLLGESPRWDRTTAAPQG